MKKILLVLLAFGFSQVFAQQNVATKSPITYTKGKEYTELETPFETSDKDHVVVYEFFGYTCPHCNHFQPYMRPWHAKLPSYVKLVRVPVIFSPAWRIYSQAYYTAETMGFVEKTHQAMFDALHKQHKRFRNIEQIADWYAENFGIDKKAFLATANSFMIDSKMRQAMNMAQKMKVTSTPSLVINGKYKPNTKVLSNVPDLFKLATYLDTQEAATMGLLKNK
jgi:thiol:disulfide interchange protein DsbA